MKTYTEQLENAIRNYLDYEIENKTFDASRGYDELFSIYDYEMRYNEVCSPVGDVDEDMVAANHDLLIEAGGNDDMDACEADTLIQAGVVTVNGEVKVKVIVLAIKSTGIYILVR